MAPGRLLTIFRVLLILLIAAWIIEQFAWRLWPDQAGAIGLTLSVAFWPVFLTTWWLTARRPRPSEPIESLPGSQRVATNQPPVSPP